MTLDEHISNFLRDGQGRIAEISVEMDDIGDDGGYRYAELKEWRKEISDLMGILYHGDWYLETGYNYIQFGDEDDEWTEEALILEIQQVRYHTGMNDMPFITFTGHYPQIVELITGGSGSGESLPTGNPLDMLVANASGIFLPEAVNPIGGMLDSDSIETYFDR